MRAVASVVALLWLAGCREERPRGTSPSATTSAAAPPPAVAEPATVPNGWRGIKLGMSETDAKKVIQNYRKDAAMGWERAERTYLTTVGTDTRQIDSVPVDSKRFHEWSIRDLDEGAAMVQTWHENGVLIAIRVTGKASPDAFTRKARETYGGPTEVVDFRFWDDRTKVHETREVTAWRGPDVTAFVWTEGSTPVLLLWSNAPMASADRDYRAAQSAPAEAAKKAAQAREDGTKF